MKKDGHEVRRGRILNRRCACFISAGVCSVVLMVACDSPAPPTQSSQPSATASAQLRATVSAPARAPSAPSPVGSAGPSDAGSDVKRRVDAGCATPWVLLELLPPAKRTVIASAREVVKAVAGASTCPSGAPRATGDVCLAYVHFYGVKYFAPHNQHKNRDALVARCFDETDCQRLARRYGADTPGSKPELKCSRALPVSGSVEPLKLR